VCGGGCTTTSPLAGKHGSKLYHSLLVAEALHLCQRTTIYLALRDAQMDVGLRGHLWQVRDAEHLVLRSDAAQTAAEGLPRPPAKASVNLIKDESAGFTCVAERLFNGE
jgi:hypothetical protein